MTSVTRNPNDLVSSLHEAMRRGRIATLRPASDYTGKPKVLRYARKIDLDVPVFDFCNWDDIPYCKSEQAFDDGDAMHKAGTLTLPYERCLFIVRAKPQAEDVPAGTNVVMNCVLLIEQLADTEIVVTIFDKEEGPDAVRFTLPDGQKTWWQAVGAQVHITLRFPTFYYRTPWEQSFLEREADKEWAGNIGSWVCACLAVLALPGVETEATTATEQSLNVNRGREQAKLRPLPLVRTINISRAIYTPRSEPGTTGRGGWIQQPHNRRSHFRTLKDGRRITVKDAKIHGGSTTPPVYEVR